MRTLCPAGVSGQLASAAERTFGGRTEMGTKIRAALEAAGVEFIDENGGGPGVRLRKRQQKKAEH
jgi:hypothetical protein